jgi:hypothetical protein
MWMSFDAIYRIVDRPPGASPLTHGESGHGPWGRSDAAAARSACILW